MTLKLPFRKKKHTDELQVYPDYQLQLRPCIFTFDLEVLVSKETDTAWRRISGFGTVFLWFVSVQYSSLSSSLAVCGFLIPLTSLGVLVLIVSLKISVRCFQTFFDSPIPFPAPYRGVFSSSSSSSLISPWTS